MQKTGLNGYVYELRVDYNNYNNNANYSKVVPYIHKYLMSKYSIE